MTTGQTIRNPIEWGWTNLSRAASVIGRAGDSLGHIEEARDGALPTVRRIEVNDLRIALSRGFGDFAAFRSDVVFLCVVYPVVGLVLARFTFGAELLPMVFPLASGFALVGPVAAVGLYEMSRRRDLGGKARWADAFAVLQSPAIGSIIALGLLLLAIFFVWLAVAYGIFLITMGPEIPASPGAFVRDVFTTSDGWLMIAIGCGAGFLFAVLVLTISVVSFPLLLDRDVGLYPAIAASVNAVRANPGVMAVWGVIVAGGLVLGSLPLFIGLVIVIPVLGHATWHLYRRVVAPRGDSGAVFAA